MVVNTIKPLYGGRLVYSCQNSSEDLGIVGSCFAPDDHTCGDAPVFQSFHKSECTFVPEVMEFHFVLKCPGEDPSCSLGQQNCSLGQHRGTQDPTATSTEVEACQTFYEEDNVTTTQDYGLHNQCAKEFYFPWVAQMCQREHQQFVKPFCTEHGIPMIGLFGQDNQCSQLIASEGFGRDLSRTDYTVNCWHHEWFDEFYGMWKWTYKDGDQMDAVWGEDGKPWSGWRYSVECTEHNMPRLRYHVTQHCSYGLQLTQNWPPDLCLDTRDSVCEADDPGFAARRLKLNGGGDNSSDGDDGPSDDYSRAAFEESGFFRMLVILLFIGVLATLLLLAIRNGLQFYRRRTRAADLVDTEKGGGELMEIMLKENSVMRAMDKSSALSIQKTIRNGGYVAIEQMAHTCLEIRQELGMLTVLNERALAGTLSTHTFDISNMVDLISTTDLQKVSTELNTRNTTCTPGGIPEEGLGVSPSSPVTGENEDEYDEYVFEGTHVERSRGSAGFSKESVPDVGTVLASASSEYTLTSFIGQGTHGVVFKAIDNETNVEYAIKVPMHENNEMHLEEACMLRLTHSNIVRLREALMHGWRKCLVLEYCALSDMQKVVDCAKKVGILLEEHFMHKVILQLSLALACMHSKSYIHRDIKLSNVYISATSDLKLGDFGTCRLLAHGFATTFAGTPLNMAPEILQREPYDRSSDIWSLGSVVFELLTLSPVFNPNTIQTLTRNHDELQRSPEVIRQKVGVIGYSPELIDLLCRMLQHDPNERISAAEIIEHPFTLKHLPQYIERRKLDIQMYTQKQTTPRQETTTRLFGASLV